MRFLPLLLALAALGASARADAPLPALEKRGAATQLIVDGQPWLIRGGEVANTASSSLPYMETVWPNLTRLNLNTVLVAVAWAWVEPEEGKFDFTLVDGLLDGATQGRLPGGVSKVKLDALDRLSDALAGTGIRRILLHTCTVGQNKAFMQAFADRVQVPMLAQTDHVEHIGFPGKLKILAHYEGVNTVSPRDLRHWPISTVAGPFRPGPKPRRFGP